MIAEFGKGRSQGSPHLRFVILLLALAGTTIASLSVHVVMFDVFEIPHPSLAGVPAWAIVVDRSVSVAAALLFANLAERRLLPMRFVPRWLLLTAIYAMLNESLLRRYVMNVVVSHDWAYCFVASIGPWANYLLLGLAVTVAAPRLPNLSRAMVAGLAIGCLDILLAKPILDRAADTLTAAAEFLDTGNIYNPPYGWQVNIPSYLTFLEPVVATFGIAALVLDKLGISNAVQGARFTLLVMAMRGAIVPTLVYSFFQSRPFTAALLSESQFALEALTLAALTVVGWRHSHKLRVSG